MGEEEEEEKRERLQLVSLFLSLTCLQNSRKTFQNNSTPRSCLTARWQSISRRGWSLKPDSHSIHISIDPAAPKPKPSSHTRCQRHTHTHSNMCLQNRALEEHNGWQKLLWALRRGGGWPSLLAIFFKASGRAKRAIGQCSSRARLTTHVRRTYCTNTYSQTHTFLSF